MTTFVLVPGGWLGGWAWRKITPLLEEKGHTVYPVTLTGMGDRIHLSTREVGMETAIQDVLNVIGYNDLDNLVLVGHSFAGKVVAAVADQIPEKVKLLLFLDAFRPEKARTPQASFTPTEFGSVPPGTWSIPFSEEILEMIGKDVKGADREWMLAKATPWPLKHAVDPITLSGAFDKVEQAYIFCTEGGDSVEEILDGKSGKLEGSYKIIEAGHWPMITKAEELADDMMTLAGA